ncbi:MAG: tryptophan-rich sensory protein [Clostridia bacterium]|nr:tryptophan-rich sensory protein [Clostridia bacterium]
MKKWIVPAIFIILPLVLGFAVSVPIDIKEIYAPLAKPPLSPPPTLFPIVWTVLYLLMGIGSYLAYKSAPDRGIRPAEILKPYIIQLIFNLLWTPVFFGSQMFLTGSVISVLIIVFLIWTMASFARVNKTAAYLQIPYLIWSVFASYLSFGIYFLNR